MELFVLQTPSWVVEQEDENDGQEVGPQMAGVHVVSVSVIVGIALYVNMEAIVRGSKPKDRSGTCVFKTAAACP